MNKSVLLTNIQNIMTSLQLTIGKLESLIAKDKSYSLEQINKQITLLKVRLQDDTNYRRISKETNYMEMSIKKIPGERNTLKRLINDVEFRSSFLRKQIDKNNSMLSYEQREVETLANSLDDEEIVRRIKEKSVKISELKSDISAILEELKVNDSDIQRYNEKIRDLDEKEEKFSRDLASLYVDEKKKSKDINKLNRFLSIRDLISYINSLNDIYLALEDLRDFLKNNRVDANLVTTQVEKMKAKMSIIISQVVYFVNSTSLDELNAEKSIINERIVSNDGYVLSDIEREMVYDEITNLELAISLNESDANLDENIIEAYRRSIDNLDSEIRLEIRQRNLLQMEVNDLVLKKNYFFNEYTQGQTDDINREIRRLQKQIDNIEKNKDNYIKIRNEIETAITFIKKKRKGLDTLIESKNSDLKNVRETAFNRPTSKYNLNEDKQELIYIDFVFELIDLSNYILSQDYTKRLEDIPVETIEPFVSVVDFYKYDNLEVLYSDEFVTQARNTVEKMLSAEVIKPEDFINELKAQGLNVPKFGKSLKSMDKTKEIDKSVRLAA